MPFTFESAGPGYTVGPGVCLEMVDDIFHIRLDANGYVAYVPRHEIHETSEIKNVGDSGVLVITRELAKELELL